MKEQINLYNKEDAEKEASEMRIKKELGLTDDYNFAEKMVEIENSEKSEDVHKIKAAELFEKFKELVTKINSLQYKGGEVKNCQFFLGRANPNYGASELGQLEKQLFDCYMGLDRTKEKLEKANEIIEYKIKRALDEMNNFDIGVGDKFNLGDTEVNNSDDIRIVYGDFCKYLDDLEIASEKNLPLNKHYSNTMYLKNIKSKVQKIISGIKNQTTEEDIKNSIIIKMESIVNDAEILLKNSSK